MLLALANCPTYLFDTVRPAASKAIPAKSTIISLLHTRASLTAAMPPTHSSQPVRTFTNQDYTLTAAERKVIAELYASPEGQQILRGDGARNNHVTALMNWILPILKERCPLGFTGESPEHAARRRSKAPRDRKDEVSQIPPETPEQLEQRRLRWPKVRLTSFELGCASSA